MELQYKPVLFIAWESDIVAERFSHLSWCSGVTGSNSVEVIPTSKTTCAQGFRSEPPYVFDLAYADDIVILSNSYRGDTMLADTFGLRIDASKAKVLSALAIGEQRQAALL